MPQSHSEPRGLLSLPQMAFAQACRLTWEQLRESPRYMAVTDLHRFCGVDLRVHKDLHEYTPADWIMRPHGQPVSDAQWMSLELPFKPVCIVPSAEAIASVIHVRCHGWKREAGGGGVGWGEGFVTQGCSTNCALWAKSWPRERFAV